MYRIHLHPLDKFNWVKFKWFLYIKSMLLNMIMASVVVNKNIIN